ncbi:MAG: hypothetical protein ABW092_05060 [Candidatus Thiodiazotropha sp.]
MNSRVWLVLSTILLISTSLQADDYGYDNRQFTINPGDAMGGMFNPMRNFFGGSNRYPDNYYDYRYAPPTTYAPGYGYPGTTYGYPPVYPGGYPSFQPLQQQQTHQQPQAPTTEKRDVQTQVPAYTHPTPTQPVYEERYRFRPLDSGEPAAPLNETSPQPPAPQATLPRNRGAMEQYYSPAIEATGGGQQQQMKFRPLDKPGYSE